MTILERLKHFEKHQLDDGDKYGAEILHNAARVIRELAGVVKAYENNERLMYRLIRNLSPDAKEVIEECGS